jgi:DNA-directed RNA polymerase subunit RPC12/RpoP
MTEYINREYAKELFDQYGAMGDALALINTIPAADVAPVRHGTWKLKMVGAFDDLKQYSCSECGFSLPLNPAKIPPYCEDCGAKMSLEEVQDG